MSSEWIVGLHAIQAVIEAKRRRVYALHATDPNRCPTSLRALLDLNRIPLKSITPQSLQRLVPPSVQSAIQQGLILEADPYPYVDLESFLRDSETPLFLLALDQIQDPHNCGALLRSAYAWGVTGVILTKDQSVMITPTVVRSSAGASEFLPIARVSGLPQQLSNLKKHGVWILGADASGVAITQSRLLSEPVVLVMGGEGSGLRQTTLKVCDECVSIPMRTNSAIDSLNVSVAGGILMWEIAKAR